MESGLEGRNNDGLEKLAPNRYMFVSMESGLEGRNNYPHALRQAALNDCLNGVRPRRPEQSYYRKPRFSSAVWVSMESGLEGRNNSPL